ncbi:CoA-acylating methylmalonate-semialdehyde dehydrogenase [Priestia megaterium]|uniref:CoA-acylating methylmalonate-semialdehyde dehydrogenase n=1 Tax=Priestia megaterium TaxID=1404 RepID=UPI002FFE19B8
MSVVNNDTQVLKNYVGGKWVDTAGGKFGEVINPSTGEIIAKVPLSTKEDVANAVETAQKTFETWRNVPAPKRARLMFAFQHLLVKHHEELAKLVVQENGKAFKEAYGEVQRGIECVEFAAGAPTLLMGESLNNIAEEIDSEMFRFPLGVVGGITPFNFPMMVPLWMFPLAIVCGNAFVLKPSERTPLLATRLAELFTEAGAPDGLLNIVHGAHDVVNGLIEHEKVKAISFVGSQPVAKYVYEQAAAQGKRVQALSGAKNHHVVMPDCDMDKAVSHIISSAYGSAGQRCMACSAVVVVGEKGDEFVAKLKQKADELIMGSGFDDEVLLTPVIRKEHRDKVLDYIELGMKEGAELIRDGRKEMDEHTEGNFLGATIFDRVTPDMTIAKEEIFGPVVAVIEVESYEEAVLIANDVEYGLSASIVTNNLKLAHQFTKDVQAGTVKVNRTTTGNLMNAPFGGVKRSSTSTFRESGRVGLEFFTQIKTVYIGY